MNPRERQSLLAELEADESTRLGACMQCRKCSSGCPIASAAEWLPSQIIQLIRLGEEREVVGSRAIWLCLSCATCTSRCPQGIDLASVMDHLRRRALAERATPAKAPEAIFNDAFLRSVRRHGRVFEMGMMTFFKLRSGAFARDVEKLPLMVRKGKIALTPPRGADARSVRALFERVG